MTLLDLAKRYPSMKHILWRNRRRDLKKEWEEAPRQRGSQIDMIPHFNIEGLGWQ